MGTWGAGLYSSDYALDLRGSIAALSRLPFDGDKLLAELRKHEVSSDDEDDEDHHIFWLVTAEQFTKRGIVCKEAVERALDIIETGKDIAKMTELGLPATSARQRKKKLDELAVTLRAPVVEIARKTLKAPQPILMQPNTAWRYPTQKGKSRNPYFATAEKEKFVADGWRALLVWGAERAFGWLAWYVVAPLAPPNPNKPELSDVKEARFFTRVGHEYSETSKEYVTYRSIAGGPGTASKLHLSRMEFECIGELVVDSKHVPEDITRLGTRAAVSDICISNQLNMMSECTADGPQVWEWARG